MRYAGVALLLALLTGCSINIKMSTTTMSNEFESVEQNAAEESDFQEEVLPPESK